MADAVQVRVLSSAPSGSVAQRVEPPAKPEGYWCKSNQIHHLLSSITEVIVESMDLLDSRNNGTQPADRPQSTYGGYSPVRTQNRSYGAGKGRQSGFEYDGNVRPSHDNPYSPDETLALEADDLPF